MPCQHLMRVKSLSSGAPKRYYVPCGHCEECRKAEQNMWSFRLRVQCESLVRQGHYMVFGTLTYRDECLPHVPRSLFYDSVPDSPVPCFDREQVRTFIDNIRKWLHRHYKVSSTSFFLASEFGSSTKRPHYHFIWMLPSSVPAVKFYDLVCRQWTFGHVFPRYFNGGVDCHGYRHKPFVVENPSDAGAYCAKYCCKDVAFYEQLNKYHVLFKDKLFRRYSDFHIQSRSLGLKFIDDVNDETKLDWLRNGVSFVGCESKVQLPRYLRNKLLFKIRYDYVDERVLLLDADGNKLKSDDGMTWRTELRKVRKVRRDPSDFFVSHINEIYTNKVNYFEKFVCNCTNKNYLVGEGVPERVAIDVSKFLDDYLQKCGMTCRDFAEAYLCYFQVPYEQCYDAPSHRSLLWYQRYRDVDFGDCPLIDSDAKYSFDLVCSFIFSIAGYMPRTLSQERRLADFVRDFIKSSVY